MPLYIIKESENPIRFLRKWGLDDQNTKKKMIDFLNFLSIEVGLDPVCKGG